MLSRTRLLLLVVLVYTAVLNMVVVRLFFQRHNGVIKLHPSGAHSSYAPVPSMTLGSDTNQTPPSIASCRAAIPAVAVAVAPTPPGATPDMRLLAALRDMLRGLRLRVELLGTAAALTPSHALWCRSAPVPCGLHQLPPSAADPDLAALTEPLLSVTPCLDDLVVLHSALPLPKLFLRQLQRLTRPGKLTCLAGRAEDTASAAAAAAPCPALAYRLPRAFLWQTRHVRGQPAALAAERGLLAPAVALVRF